MGPVVIWRRGSMLFGLGMLLQDMGKPEKARLQLEEDGNAVLSGQGKTTALCDLQQPERYSQIEHVVVA
eukprot:scaffold21360_cov65-Phaeocystis_antarctica.AAC.6